MNSLTLGLAHLGYFGILAGMFLESCAIPLPSEIILPFGGYLVHQGKLNFWLMVLAGMIGGLLGSWLLYWIGLRGGRPLLEKYGRYVGIRAQAIQHSEVWFGRFGPASVLVGRLLPGIRTYISLPAGIAAMPFGKFTWLTLIGSLPWTVVLVEIGVRLGANWDSISSSFRHFQLAVVVLVLFLIVVWLWRRYRTGRPVSQ